MNSLAVIDVASPLSGAQVWSDGTLAMHQRAPFNSSGTNSEYNTAVVPLEVTPVSVAPYQQENILETYLDRKCKCLHGQERERARAREWRGEWDGARGVHTIHEARVWDFQMHVKCAMPYTWGLRETC